ALATARGTRGRHSIFSGRGVSSAGKTVARQSSMRSRGRGTKRRGTDVAQIDRLAALDELKKAAHLKEQARQLVEIADELQEEATRHEHDALDLIAPSKSLASPNGRRS